ncbi:caspase family protein [Maridesulfovibrio sp.]|uniref:caspase family protein n=1 Tax=Maridesulfovibrio sp. TaxID=2795000 RepID=UPI003BA8A51B
MAKDLCLGARTLADVAVKTFQKDMKKGLSSMIRASKMCPDDKAISYNLGVMYYKYKRPDKAYEILAPLAEKSGTAKDAATVGWLAFKLGRYDLAEKWALKAGGKDKSSARLRLECYYRKGKYREAMKYVSARQSLLSGEKKKAAGYMVEQQWQLFRRGDKELALQGMAELSHEFSGVPLFSEEVSKMAVALGDDSLIPLPEPLPDQVASAQGAGVSAVAGTYSEALKIRGTKQTAKTTDKAYAVIVGIRKYRNIKGPRYADNDAKQMYNLLTRKAGFKNDSAHVKLLLNGEATYGNIINAVDWLDKKARLNPGAKIVFYFSGHGSPVLTADRKGFADGLLVPSEAILSGISSRTAISMKELDQQFGRIKNRNVVMIIDACFSGPKSATGMKLIVPKVKKSFLSSKKQVITASAADRPAEEYPSGRQGAFSYFFMKAMLGEGDSDGSGWVDTLEAFNYAKAKLQALDLDQNPQVSTKTKVKLCKVK